MILLFSTNLLAKKSNWLTDWEVKDKDDGITIECREHKTKINECRYVTEVENITVDALLAVNIDGPNLNSWTDNLISCEVIEKKHPLDYQLYMKWSFPGAINRDSITHTTVTHDAKRGYSKLSFRTVKNQKKPKDLSFVRFQAMKGTWEFEDMHNGKTKITLTQIALPGEYVQSILYSLYNLSNRMSTRKTLVSLIDIAKTEKYRGIVIDYSVLSKNPELASIY